MPAAAVTLLLQLTATALLLLSSKAGSSNSLRSDTTASFGNVALSIVEGLITNSGGNVFAVADNACNTHHSIALGDRSLVSERGGRLHDAG